MAYPVIQEIQPYCSLLDVAQTAGLTTELDISRHGWTLEVLRGNEVLVRCESRKKPPECFRSLGLDAAAGLSKLQ